MNGVRGDDSGRGRLRDSAGDRTAGGVDGGQQHRHHVGFPSTAPTSRRRTLWSTATATGSCNFTVGADMRTPDGVTGFPAGLWARQSTEIRPTNRLAHLDVHATAQYDRVMNEGGSDVITTVYFGEAAGQVPDHRPIDSTDWSTGQPRTDEKVTICTHIQVVYTGVNITSPSTCAQTAFSLGSPENRSNLRRSRCFTTLHYAGRRNGFWPELSDGRPDQKWWRGEHGRRPVA